MEILNSNFDVVLLFFLVDDYFYYDTLITSSVGLEILICFDFSFLDENVSTCLQSYTRSEFFSRRINIIQWCVQNVLALIYIFPKI